MALLKQDTEAPGVMMKSQRPALQDNPVESAEDPRPMTFGRLPSDAAVQPDHLEGILTGGRIIVRPRGPGAARACGAGPGERQQKRIRAIRVIAAGQKPERINEDRMKYPQTVPIEFLKILTQLFIDRSFFGAFNIVKHNSLHRMARPLL
ncbi:hypothetical protein D1F64_09815 [Breoghania sp. L-A4]|nr:hypothetical protein D1F64_09815 [Breoghania sp. L-A4]